MTFSSRLPNHMPARRANPSLRRASRAASNHDLPYEIIVEDNLSGINISQVNANVRGAHANAPHNANAAAQNVPNFNQAVPNGNQAAPNGNQAPNAQQNAQNEPHYYE